MYRDIKHVSADNWNSNDKQKAIPEIDKRRRKETNIKLDVFFCV